MVPARRSVSRRVPARAAMAPVAVTAVTLAREGSGAAATGLAQSARDMSTTKTRTRPMPR
jgi:hypothetical protein